jgi:UPF0755 protein
MKRGLLTLALLIAGAGLALLVGYHQAKSRFEAPGPLDRPLVLVIEKGAGLDAIARKLSEAGVIASRPVFILMGKLSGLASNLKAGEYAFSPAISAKAAMEKLAAGDVVIHRFTLVEGWTNRQLFDAIKAETALAGELPKMPAEGRLLPETYHFTRGETRAQMLSRMAKAMDEALTDLWAKRAEGLVLKTQEEAVILASIVEKETAVASERARVAQVFHNRLKKGMRLQSDPTVIYGLTEGAATLDRALTRDDLNRPTRWNTYMIEALPPTPIANPGRASLQATLYPAGTDELYFVADGTGGHAFASNLEEHNRNVAKWRRIEAERAK